jgi:hypothetical protein
MLENWTTSYVAWIDKPAFAGYMIRMRVDAHPALTGRAPNWRGPPDREFRVPKGTENGIYRIATRA